MKKMENTNKAKDVTLDNTGEIELPKLDVSEFVGKDVQIVKVQEKEGQYGNFSIISTEVVKTIEREGKDNIELCGSRQFGLQEDEEHNIGWGKDTKLGQFLAKMKVPHYNDLVGKTVKLQTQTVNGTDFLTFN